MPNLDEMKNQASEEAQSDEARNTEQQAGDTAETDEQKSGGKMDDVKKKMDVTGDGKFDMEDAKKMGKDAADKVKGMFNKKS
jgi:hypothetical protein